MLTPSALGFWSQVTVKIMPGFCNVTTYTFVFLLNLMVPPVTPLKSAVAAWNA